VIEVARLAKTEHALKMHIRKLTFASAIVAIGAVFAGENGADVKDEMPTKLEWDLHDGHRLCAVDWPEEVTEELLPYVLRFI